MGILDYFIPKIATVAEESWTQWILGNKDTYAIDVDILDEIWQDSILDLTNDTILSLSEKGLVDSSVNQNGDMTFKISEEGIQLLSSTIFKK